MSSDGIRRLPVVLLAAAALSLVAANVVSASLMQVALHGMSETDPLTVLAAMVAESVLFVIDALVLVGGVALALHLKRPGRSLLAITPAAFVVFFALSAFEWLSMYGSGGMVMALSGSIGRTGLLVALVLVGWSARLRFSDVDPADVDPADVPPADATLTD